MLNVIFLCVVLSFSSCRMDSDRLRNQVDNYNFRSYCYRYVNIDSTLSYADKAYRLSTDYRSGREQAMINRAYVAYQQMSYDVALNIVHQLSESSQNQYNLLCADVLTMKIAQRIGDGEEFFRCRNHALEILQRIQEGHETNVDQYTYLVNYAASELHIISSTYYFYLNQNFSAIDEIQKAGDYVKNSSDRAQELYYMYMLGSGGLIRGNSQNVLLKEFDYLFKTYKEAAVGDYIYFTANALQAMAVMLSDTTSAHVISQQRKYELQELYDRHLTWGADTSFCVALAHHALHLFVENKDLFQTACAYRTLGEIFFTKSDFKQAHRMFLKAISLVETQKSRSTKMVIPWMAGIREKLSLTYSALGYMEWSDYNRAIYLELLEQFRQNYEEELRLEELQQEQKSVHIRTLWLLLLILLTFVLAWFLARRMKRKEHANVRHISDYLTSSQFVELQTAADSLKEKLLDEKEYMQEQTHATLLHIDTYKSENIERRAKVSMVYSIMPYLNRISSEVTHLYKQKKVDTDRLQYVRELTTEINIINNQLTNWIKMTQGRLDLHITTFPLKSILDIISLSSHAFDKKGLQLIIDDTDVQVKADKSLTLFMINTLTDNARKFTPSGGIVHIEVKPEEDCVEIAIVDTGIGMDTEDVLLLNGNKVYDAQKISGPQQSKGFGFGIMNCKGIINKYKKSSRIFHVCDFGVSSSKGKGSRFWFKLPRVFKTILLLLMLSITVSAQQLSPREENADTVYILGRHMNLAREALESKDWNAYRRHNAEYVRLHYLYTQDSAIPAYCKKMEKLQAESDLIYVLLILFSLIALFLFYRLFLRVRLRTDRQYKMLFNELNTLVNKTVYTLNQIPYKQAEELQALSDSGVLRSLIRETEQKSFSDAIQNIHVKHILEQIRIYCVQIQQDIDQLLEEREQKARYQFEEDRLYVMNQILDNCLSTIKHETMYYPARTLQLVDYLMLHPDEVNELGELQSLVSFYKELHLLLYRQAALQLEQNCFRRTSVSIRKLLQTYQMYLTQELNARRNTTIKGEITVPDTDYHVLGDTLLLHSLFNYLLQDYWKIMSSLQVVSEDKHDFIQLTFCITMESSSEYQDLSGLFTPGTCSIAHFVSRQIIREHDAYSGYPGLRLYAEKDGTHSIKICFTLLKSV